MLDPLQDVFGGRMGGLLFLPALCGEVFWSAGILAALGKLFTTVVHKIANYPNKLPYKIQCFSSVKWSIFHYLCSVLSEI